MDELVFANQEKDKRAAELVIAIKEKAKCEAELVIANVENEKQSAGMQIAEEEKAKRADELVVAEEEKHKRVAELVIANEEKAKRVAELVIDNEEKAKRVAELVIANSEKQKRVAELVVADEEKQKRVAELIIDNEEKAKRVAELILAEEEKAKRVAELVIINDELQRLLQLNSDKDLFISILAHDLRSPFTALLGISEVLIDNLQTYSIEETVSLLKHIKTASQETSALLEDLLKWTSTQSGKIPFNPQTLNFAGICKNILETLNNNAYAKNITVNCSLSDQMSVYADMDMLKTVMRNLVSNALKFTQTGGSITIDAEENSEFVTISVSDNGMGIQPEKLLTLFDISKRQTTKGTEDESGTGLGLILCKEFIEMNRGEIWVESEYGKGSDFKFTLPVADHQPF